MDRVLKMESFVIPYGKSDSCYISFSVSIETSGKAMWDEIMEKMGIVRGNIYDRLLIDLSRVYEMPTPGSIKDTVIEGVNEALSGEKVFELYLTQFLII